MKTDRVILKETSPKKDLPYIHQNRAFSQREAAERNEQLVKEAVYQNRIFHIKKIFILPKESIDLNEMKPMIRTLDNEPTKFKPSEGFSRYIDVLQKNKALLRRGVCETPIQPPLFLSQRERRRMKTEESHKQQIVVKERVKTCISSTKGMESMKQSANPETKQLFANTQILKKRSLVEKPSLIQQQLRAFRTISIQRHAHRSFKDKILMQKQEAIKVRNEINRRLGMQMITYNMLGKRHQWLKN